ncbi:hypothetical protein B0T20DRAFT_149405 [Sordaria brevicollis]|uniref:HMG box domain-containing protein n=1 Tax=Sordaria brevicollis TaxID=83679 RepID=A0AAE0PIP0_SORBR|nr:hypothetical protein B0T20DRAFT_149405 [Sordaria brevicollis]
MTTITGLPRTNWRDARSSWHPALENLLTVPMTENADVAHIPLRDLESFVSRSVEARQAEAALSRTKSKRPTNTYLLYQKACLDRVSAWRKAHASELPKGNDMRCSMIMSRSWALESSSVRAKYKALAEIDLEIHEKAFPGWATVQKPLKRQVRSKKLSDAFLTTEAVKLPTSKDAQVFAAAALSLPHILDRLFTLTSHCRELEDLLQSCVTSEVMCEASWPTDKGLDYQMAVLRYNDFLASVHDKLEEHVADKKLLEPYVTKVYDLQFTFDDASASYMDIDPQLDGMFSVANGDSTNVDSASFMDVDPQLDGMFDNIDPRLENMFKDMDAVPSMSAEDVEKAFQESCANGASTAETEIVVDEAVAAQED